MARIAFFGTPELAATQLRTLLATQHDVVLVVVQPDRPKGRGQKLEPPPVKALALGHHLQVVQPETLKKDTPSGEDFFRLFAASRVDMAVVAAYGRIIPRRLLDLPQRGFVNVHASLLPRWRGAAPIQRCIEAGDTVAGVCLMHMVPQLDAGDVYARAEVPVTEDDDGETLTRKVADAGAVLLSEHIDALLDGKLPRVPQPTAGITYANQLTKDEGRIDWSRGARGVRNHARAMHPWPGAFTTLDGEVLKLFMPSAAPEHGEPGVVLRAGGEALVVGTGDGAVAFREAQLPNRKRMAVADLVRGRPIPAGIVLGEQRT